VHVDLAAAGPGHLDLVVALLVADLAGGDAAAADAIEGDPACPLERGTGDGLLGRPVVGAGLVVAAGRAGDRRASGRERGRRGARDEHALVLHVASSEVGTEAGSGTALR
jgi:hypothetical protein